MLPEIDKRWEDPETWRLLQRAAARYTPDFLLRAIDREVAPGGSIVPVDPSQAVYLRAFARTFAVSASVTLICLALGYPVAYLLATLPTRQSNFLMIFVIVPFWTSLLVRTTAWYVLLQPNGVVNSLLLKTGLTSAPVALMFNRTGVLIGMTHVLLPFMILANYAVMRGISPAYQRAAVRSARTRRWRSCACTCRRRCPASGPGPSSCSCWRSATTSRRPSWAVPATR